MNLAIEHLQKQVRIIEAQIAQAQAAHDAEQKQANQRKAEIENMQATLGELRSAVAVLNGKPVVEPVEKKKRA